VGGSLVSSCTAITLVFFLLNQYAHYPDGSSSHHHVAVRARSGLPFARTVLPLLPPNHQRGLSLAVALTHVGGLRPVMSKGALPCAWTVR
jgi:hypothetical protein